MSEQDDAARLSTARPGWTLVTAAVGGAAAVAAGLIPFGHADRLPEALAAGAACLAAALLAQWPVGRMARRGGDAVLYGVMAALVIRPTLSIAFIAALALLTPIHPLILALWALPWYLWLLLVEVVILRRFLRRLDGRRKGGAAC